MTSTKTVPTTIDEYIANYPADVQVVLQKIRATITKAAPKATETISYGMPAFMLDGRLVYYAAFKNHVGFYPRQSVMEALKKDVAPYASAKSSLKFPLDKPVPYGLITKIVKYRVKENMERAAAKKKI